LLFIEVADARDVWAVTSGPLYRFLLGFERRKNVIGMVLDNEVSDPISFLLSLETNPTAPLHLGTRCICAKGEARVSVPSRPYQSLRGLRAKR
jgi:hypothetical protein